MLYYWFVEWITNIPHNITIVSGVVVFILLFIAEYADKFNSKKEKEIHYILIGILMSIILIWSMYIPNIDMETFLIVPVFLFVLFLILGAIAGKSINKNFKSVVKIFFIPSIVFVFVLLRLI